MLSHLETNSTDNNPLSRVLDAVIAKQNLDGSFTGSIESDPSIEMLFLLLSIELGKNTSELQAEVMHRIFSWKGDSIAWPIKPNGELSIDITGIILLGLESIGIKKTHRKVNEAWQWFESQGGIDALNLSSIMLLKPLKLTTCKFKAMLNPLIFAIPQKAEVNIWSIGILRNMLIPLVVQQFYAERRFVLPVKEERIHSNGSYFGYPKTKLLTLFPKNFWAQEGLGFMLNHQQPDGNFYAFQITYLYVLMLNTVQKRGAYEVQEQIDKAWEGLLSIKSKNRNNEMFISTSDSTGWDTPRLISAIHQVPAYLRNTIAKKQSIRKSIDWLLDKQLFNKGDWSHNAPNLRPGGWSFVPDNIWLPDTDVSAAAVSALLAYQLENPSYRSKPIHYAISRGLEWIIGMQNKDGSFPAWDTGNTSYLPKMLSLLHPNPPAIEDLGQPDLTSRIIELFLEIKNKATEHYSIELEQSLTKACDYLLSARCDTEPSIWRGDWAVNYLYATSSAISALLSARKWSLTDAKKSLNWIASLQNADGGWGESHTSFTQNNFEKAPSTAMQTSFIIEGFLTYEEQYEKTFNQPSPYRATIEKAITYLIYMSHSGALTKEKSYTGVLVKQICYANYELVPSIRTLHALGRYQKLIPIT